MDFGFFTGDIVFHSTADYWDAAEVDIDKLDMPIYLAAGNHDVSEEFENRFGDYYYSFVQNSDLFIILAPSLDQWNIIGEQLDFLTSTLEENYQNVDNIFIFLHELIWWSPTNEYQDVIINFVPSYPGSTNFDTEIKPLLLSYPNPITLFAGDLGATSVVSFAMYHHFDNITLIGSGMGNGNNDNIIITDVYQDSLYHHLVAINGDDPNALGELSDYSILSTTQNLAKKGLNIFPNPANNIIQIASSNTNHLSNKLSATIINIMGISIDEFRINEKIITKDVSRYPTGLYFFIIREGDKVLETHRIIIE